MFFEKLERNLTNDNVLFVSNMRLDEIGGHLKRNKGENVFRVSLETCFGVFNN